MSSRFRERALAAIASAAVTGAVAGELRVCAHPDNLPFSHASGAGFENRIAQVVARDLGATLQYTWLFPPRGLVRKTLGSHACDVLLGVPAGLERVETTRPYYRSSYVWVSRTQPPLASFDDARLRQARVGIAIGGDDGAMTPPAQVLATLGFTGNVRGFAMLGDGPAGARLVNALASGELDTALAWGPAVGYFASLAPASLTVTRAHAPASFERLPFEFAVAMAVRLGDTALRDRLDAALARHREEIDAILAEYHVPLAAEAAK